MTAASTTVDGVKKKDELCTLPCSTLGGGVCNDRGPARLDQTVSDSRGSTPEVLPCIVEMPFVLRSCSVYTTRLNKI